MADDSKIIAGGPVGYMLALPFTTGQGLPVMNTETDLRFEVADWTGAGWTALPTLTGDCSIKFDEESDDVWPLHLLGRTSDVIIKKMIDEINLTYSEAHIAALKLSMSSWGTSTVAASTGIAGYTLLKDGGASATKTYYQAAFEFVNDAGKSSIFVAKKVRPIGSFDLKMGHHILTIPTKLKCFGLSTEPVDEQFWSLYEYTTAAT